MSAILRAIVGYLFLVGMMRVVGRRPGKQLTPFEFVLIFYIGGLSLTGIVGDERSMTNAVLQIVAIALGHRAILWARGKSRRFARLIDGTPLILFEKGRWRSDTMQNMRIQSDDVLFAARDHGLQRLEDVERAALERDGSISVIATARAKSP